MGNQVELTVAVSTYRGGWEKLTNGNYTCIKSNIPQYCHGVMYGDGYHKDSFRTQPHCDPTLAVPPAI